MNWLTRCRRRLAGATGCLEGTSDGLIVGWAWDPACPDTPVSVEIMLESRSYRTICACIFRPDLLAAGIGNGAHGFQLRLRDVCSQIQDVRVSARISGTDRWLVESRPRVQDVYDVDALRVGPDNITALLRHESRIRVRELLVDINDMCNADCVYCPRGESKARMEIHDFQRLMGGALNGAHSIQMGCGREPTLDPRLTDFFACIASAPIRPQAVKLITNGMLLRRFDPRRWVECGLRVLIVSLDTLDPALNRQIRIGTDVATVIDCVRWFRGICPEVEVHFSVVVSSLTIGGVDDLIDTGKHLGISGYIFREILPLGDPSAAPRRPDFDGWFERLALAPGQFEGLAIRLEGHSRRDAMMFLDAGCLARSMPRNTLPVRNRP